MKTILLLILMFFPSNAAIALCEDFKIEELKVLDWLDGDPPWVDKDFDNSTWEISHLEIPMQRIRSASKTYLKSDAFVEVENSDVKFLMNTDLIKLPSGLEKAYLVAGLIYDLHGKISMYWDSVKKTIHITHGSFHLNTKPSTAQIRKNFMYQPVIVYLKNRPDKASGQFTAGSASALRSLCDA